MVKEEAPQKKVSRIKVKKKQWYKIIAPKIFGLKEMGEAYFSSSEVGWGRTLKINLKDLTNNVKDQNALVSFQIQAAQGSTLPTKVIGYALTTAYIKRAVRKNISRIDEVLYCTTAGGKKVVLKALVITLHKTQRSIRNAIRKVLTQHFQEEIGKTDFATFIYSLVTQKSQSALRKKLNKIYPVKEVAVKMIYLEEKELGKEEIVVEQKPPESVPAPAPANGTENKEV